MRVNPCECPSFYSCNASVCPLEPEVGHHRQGEQACPRARRLATGRSDPNTPLHHAILAGVSRVRDRFPDIARKLDAPLRPFSARSLSALRKASLSGGAPAGISATPRPSAGQAHVVSGDADPGA
jgi:hypothetical protein